MSRAGRDARRNLGFTLVEMLVVVGIIAVLIGLLAPTVGTMIRGPLVTQSSDLVISIFNLAQQTAVTRNQAVEVRFYQYADPSVPGETIGNASSGKFRALQLFLVSDNGTVAALSAVESLPASIIADSGATLSTLLADSSRQKQWTTADPKLSLPRPGTTYNCSAFRFRPDGSTNLTTGNWFVTLYHQKEGDARANPPANYVTIQVDPFNGASTVFRP